MAGSLLKRDNLVFAEDDGGVAPKDRLMGILSQESQAYGELVELSQREQEALLARDVLALAEVVRRKEELAQKVGELEQRRLKAIGGWCHELNAHLVEPTLAELLPYLEEGDARELDGLRGKILGQIEELAAINQRNALLLASALALVDASLNFILGRGNIKQATYSGDGQLKPPAPGRGVVDLSI